MKRSIITSTVYCVFLIAAAGCAQSQSTSSDVPAEPSTAGRAAPVNETPLDQMTPARVVGKIGAPVEVRYQFAHKAVRDQPTPLELAFVSRVEGKNLKIEFVASDSVTVEPSAVRLTEQKLAPTRAVRRNILVTPRKSSAGEVRMLVSMDVDGGRFFSVFAIPIGE